MGYRIGVDVAPQKQSALKLFLQEHGFETTARISDIRALAALVTDEVNRETSDLCQRAGVPVFSLTKSVDHSANIISVSECSALPQKLHLKFRQLAVEREHDLRLETVRDLGGLIRSQNSERVGRNILILSEPSAFFLACQSHFKSLGFRVQGALTERTAYDALKEMVPAAILFHLDGDQIPAELIDHVHGRADLFHTPIIAMASADTSATDLPENVNFIVEKLRPYEQTFDKLIGIIENHQRISPISSNDCEPPIRDRYSGAFTDQFLRSHISRQIGAAEAKGLEHMTVRITAHYAESGEPVSATDLSLFASTLTRLLRREDALARLDWTSFLLSMPDTNQTAALKTLNRVRSVMECMQIRSGDASHMSFDFTCFPYAHGDGADFHLRKIEASAITRPRKDRQAAVA